MIYNDKNSFIKHRDVSVSNYNYKARSQEHSHTFFELAYIVSGEGVHIVDGRAVPVRKGCYFLLDKNASHCYDGNIEVLNLTFNPSFLDKNYCDIVTVSELYDKMVYKTDYRLPVSDWNCHIYYDEGMLEKRIRYVQDEIEQMKFGYEECARIAIFEIIMCTIRSVVCCDTEHDTINNIKKYVNEHYSETILLTQICSSMGYSLPYISKLFREATGNTFSQYLQRTRIEAACSIFVKNSRLHIREVAAMVGYRDMKQFTAVFKKIKGTTPRKFCKSVKE